MEKEYIYNIYRFLNNTKGFIDTEELKTLFQFLIEKNNIQNIEINNLITQAKIEKFNDLVERGDKEEQFYDLLCKTIQGEKKKQDNGKYVLFIQDKKEINNYGYLKGIRKVGFTTIKAREQAQKLTFNKMKVVLEHLREQGEFDYYNITIIKE